MKRTMDMKPGFVDIDVLRQQLPFQKLRQKGGKRIQIRLES